MIVLVECYHDMALARCVGVRKSDLRHEHCKGNILNRLRRAMEPATGLIDADPGGLPLRELQNYRETNSSAGLRLLLDARDGRRKLIEMHPRLEEWLATRASASHVDLSKYGLPTKGPELHHNPRCDRKPGFSEFLQDLLAADEGMKTLQKWLVG